MIKFRRKLKIVFQDLKRLNMGIELNSRVLYRKNFPPFSLPSVSLYILSNQNPSFIKSRSKRQGQGTTRVKGTFKLHFESGTGTFRGTFSKS